MQKIKGNARDLINDALNERPADGLRKVTCPVCGSTYSHIRVDSLSEIETGTRQGGHLICFDYECGHDSFSFIIAEHKGECVCGELRSEQLQKEKKLSEKDGWISNDIHHPKTAGHYMVMCSDGVIRRCYWNQRLNYKRESIRAWGNLSTTARPIAWKPNVKKIMSVTDITEYTYELTGINMGTMYKVELEWECGGVTERATRNLFKEELEKYKVLGYIIE